MCKHLRQLGQLPLSEALICRDNPSRYCRHIPSIDNPSRYGYTPCRCRHIPCRCRHIPCRCRHIPCRCRHIPCRCRHTPCRCRHTPCRCRHIPCRCRHRPLLFERAFSFLTASQRSTVVIIPSVRRTIGSMLPRSTLLQRLGEGMRLGETADQYGEGSTGDGSMGTAGGGVAVCNKQWPQWHSAVCFCRWLNLDWTDCCSWTDCCIRMF
jgi:hypothetical protein